MTRPWRSLRIQLLLLGFAAIVVPLVVVLIVSEVTETTVIVDGVEVTESARTRPSPWVMWTIIGLAPLAAVFAWRLAAHAVRPIEHVRRVAQGIEASDLTRRIGLTRGPSEVVELAASFDTMLDRLEHAADTQRQLIEEASHELRTPLAVLVTNSDVLLAHPEPTVALYREGLERAGSTATRLQDVIGELLVDARGRARTITRRPADVAAIVRDVAGDAMTLATAESVGVTVDAPEVAEIAIDDTTVRRAVANVVHNAIRFAPAGSTVTIELRLDDQDATITVTDHGPGIAPEDQERVFQRFWQGRPDGDGRGLGLAIARQVALAHGGDTTIRSPGPAGDGCQVQLRLHR